MDDTSIEDAAIEDSVYTAADALNDALVKAGVTHVFLNSGTDYPPIIETWAKCEALGRPKPEIIISPHEYAAISAAQGFAQATGRMQAVFVHVDVGTQNLGGAIHNAFRCRTPVFILAGLSPYTIEGELKGGRDSPIQFVQNAADQAGIVRGYTKLNLELKSGKNAQQMVYRAVQVANSEPKGPVYMMASREPLEEEGVEINADLAQWGPIAPMAMDDASLELIAGALAKAKNPMIITAYLGRNENAVGELSRLCERLAIPVIENYMTPHLNLPGDHPCHFGNAAPPLLKEADVVLAIDCDLPWVPAMAKPRDGCRVFYLDVDPLKEDIPIWYIPAERMIRVDSYTALKQLNARFDTNAELLDMGIITARREMLAEKKAAAAGQRAIAEKQQDVMTPAFVSACVREIVDDDTIILNETISSGGAVSGHIPRVKPGTLFGSGGSSLGWACGAAFGVKLARPESDVIALVGDGTYVFSIPTAVYWMSRRYNAPFMTVIFNNQGWNAPKQITASHHPDGYAVKGNKFWNSFDPPARLDLIAEAAGGAFARTVEKPEDLRAVLQEARAAIKSGTSAVVNVILPAV